MGFLRVPLEFHVEQCLGLSSWSQPDLFDTCFILFLESYWNLSTKKTVFNEPWDLDIMVSTVNFRSLAPMIFIISEGTLSRARHWWQFCTGSIGCCVAFWILPVHARTRHVPSRRWWPRKRPRLGELKIYHFLSECVESRESPVSCWNYRSIYVI